jgi:hypothetical protein
MPACSLWYEGTGRTDQRFLHADERRRSSGDVAETVHLLIAVIILDRGAACQQCEGIELSALPM